MAAPWCLAPGTSRFPASFQTIMTNLDPSLWLVLNPAEATAQPYLVFVGVQTRASLPQHQVGFVEWAQV